VNCFVIEIGPPSYIELNSVDKVIGKRLNHIQRSHLKGKARDVFVTS
jgi:hypothetical protein